MRPASIILALATVSMVSAQQQTPTFKSAVTLVTVDVTVLDKDGRPVPGLTADDFRIKLNGKMQPVQTLTYVDVMPPSASNASSTASAAEVTGRRVLSNTAPQTPQRVFVVTVDDMSFPSEGGNRLLKAAHRFVDQQPRDVFVGLTTSSGRVVVNPTLDRTAVIEALSRVRGDFRDPRKSSIANAAAVGIAEAIEIVDHNNNATLDSMLHRECGEAGKSGGRGGGASAAAISNYNEACANAAMNVARTIAAATQETTGRQIGAIVQALDAMKGARGLKQMLLLSEGVASTRGATDVATPISRAAARAGVQLSVIMEDAEDVDISDSAHSLNDLGAVTYNTGVSTRLRDDRAMFRSSLQTLATVAGGTFDLVIGAGEKAFEHAVTAGSAVYRLGVETPAEMPKSKLLDVDVSVTRSDVIAHANDQVLAEGDAVARTASDDVSGAMRSGQVHFQVPLRLAVVRRRASANANVELGLGLEVPASVKGPLKITLGLVDQKGGLKQGSRTLPVPPPNENYAMTLPMLVDPGMYGLRVAVTDASGNVGSLEMNVEARLPAMGAARMSAFSASDILTWWTDGAGNSQLLALDDVPAGLESLGAGLELYSVPGVALPSGLSVTMSVVHAGADSVLLSREATLHAGRDMTRAEVSLPIADLPAGSYVLKASVKVGTQVVGEASALVTKR